jgi:hypothetical protein
MSATVDIWSSLRNPRVWGKKEIVSSDLIHLCHHMVGFRERCSQIAGKTSFCHLPVPMCLTWSSSSLSFCTFMTESNWQNVTRIPGPGSPRTVVCRLHTGSHKLIKRKISMTLFSSQTKEPNQRAKGSFAARNNVYCHFGHWNPCNSSNYARKEILVKRI